MTDDTLDQDKLRDLLARTAQLPREVEPPADAWAGIKAAIESRPKSARVAVWQRPAFLLAASLLLVAGSSMITALALRKPDAVAAGPIADAPQSITALAVRGDPATLAEFTAIENDYISTANRLSAMLESEQVQLAPQTMEKLRESVRIIDAAILEARRALAEDPANKQLIEMLSTSYNQKLDLLRRTADMGRS